MKRITAVVLVVVMTFLCPVQSEGGGNYMGRGDWIETAIELAIVFVCAFALDVILQNIKDRREGIVDGLRGLHVKNIEEMQWDTTMYAHDHRPLDGGDELLPDITPDLNARYAALSGGGGVFFKASAGGEFDTFLRGYGEPSPADYPGDYKLRLSKTKEYAEAVLRANRDSGQRMRYYQDQKILANLNDAANEGTPEDELEEIWESEFEALKEFHNILPYRSDKPRYTKYDKVHGAIRRAGYRRAIQANGLAADFRNGQLANVRAVIMTQMEADAKMAANSQSERAELFEAFGRGVAAWVDSGTGTNY